MNVDWEKIFGTQSDSIRKDAIDKPLEAAHDPNVRTINDVIKLQKTLKEIRNNEKLNYREAHNDSKSNVYAYPFDSVS